MPLIHLSTLVLLSGLLAPPEAIVWDLSAAAEIEAVRNFGDAALSDGRLQGTTQWDPYVMLRLPEGGVDASVYRTLRVRLYSSAPADLLDIYYRAADGAWCLGGSLPIKAGWAVYSVDLPSNAWRETPNPAWRIWGGPGGQVTQLRIDPGNQADRWLMLDWVRLETEPAETATGIEPRADVVVRDVAAQPSPAVAGDTVTVRLTADVRAVAGHDEPLVAYARLQSGPVVVASATAPVPALPGAHAVTLELATPRGLATDAALHAGIYEAADPEQPVDDVAGRVVITAPAGTGEFPEMQVRAVGGDPAMVVDGQPEPLFAMSIAGATNQLVEPSETLHAAAARHGVDLFSDWFGNSGAGFLGRLEDGSYDYTLFDRYFSRVLQAAPNARFLPHVYVTPPLWWQEANEAERVLYDDGTRGPQSFWSAKWRDEIGDDLRRLVEHLRRSPFADRILGLVVCSGYSAEWQSWGLWLDKLGDYSDPAVAAWQQWLAQRYPSDAALQAAWGDATATRAGAVPPTREARHGASLGILRDPVADRYVIDYQTFINEGTADAILHFARVLKDASDGRLLFGTYYGYLTAHQYRQAESGHTGILRVLESPDVDFLMSPPMYADRSATQVSGFMSAAASVQRHGKLWLSEADYRTHRADPGAGYGRVQTREESLAVLWREMANILTRRAGVSWYDMTGDWLAEEPLLEALGEMGRVAEAYLPEREPWRPEVAVFIDTDSFYYVKPQPNPGSYLTMQPIVHLQQSGAPFDVFVLDDLTAELPDYKLYVFLNAYALDAGERARIAERLARPGAAALWHGPAGYVWPDQQRLATPEEIQALTGVAVQRLDETLDVRLAPEPAAGDWAARLGAVSERANRRVALGPAYLPQGDVLARLDAGGHPGLVRGRGPAGPAFAAALPLLPPALYRAVYREVGVHLYVDTDDALYADDGFVGLHTATAGPRRIVLPQPRLATAVRGEGVWRDGVIPVDLPAGETVLFRLGQ